MERHYGMDWLRIGAFAILILYHVGMVFVPWEFQVKTAHPADWVAVPMLLPNAWRLTLLFVVSGYASRALLSKSSGLGAFLGNRSARLLWPLLFWMAVIVPPQTWVELVTQHGYAQGFGWFVVHHYFRFGRLGGIIMPTWNHLWFVVYLWVYTLVLVGVAAMTRRIDLQPLYDRLFAGSRALWLPMLYLLIFQVLVFRRGVETHDLFGDGIAHLAYFPALLFGFGLAGSVSARRALSERWAIATVLALGSYAAVGGTEWLYPGDAVPPAALRWTFRIAREVQTWASIAALIGIAERFWNRDHRWRPMLVEAVFPFYIIHQTLIVGVEYALRSWSLPAPAEFAILVVATVAGCWAFYLIGREVAPLRPLIGLKPRSRRSPARGELAAA